MNTRFAVLVALMLPATLRAQDSTASAPAKEETLFGRMGIKSAHIAFGGGSTPYVARTTKPASTAELRVGLTLRRLPDWTIVFASNNVGDWDTTGYVVPNSNGYHPHLAAISSGIEVQRRWSSNSLIHPVATAGAGQLINSYNYSFYPKTGAREFHQDETTTVSYATLAGGGELNLAGWLHFVVTAGYRAAGSSSIPYGTGSNSGFSTVALLEFGKF